MIKWCKKYILPVSRSNIFIHQDGVCKACKIINSKKNKRKI